jgi:hypothetical protein
MNRLKEMIEQWITGIKNKISPDGSFAGKQPQAIPIYLLK